MLFNNKKPAEGSTHDFSPRFIDARETAFAPPPLNQALVGSRTVVAPPRSVIDASLTISGDLESDGEVQVDGRIHGNIRCSQLIVGKDGMIDGDIIAKETIVRGTVKGIIRSHRVILQDGAKVESDIFHTTLAIEQGAAFDGQCRHRADPLEGVEGGVSQIDEPVAA